MDPDPVALEHFELAPVPPDVLGGEEPAVWELRLSGGTIREAFAEAEYVAVKEYVFAVPLDVLGKLAQLLTDLYERQSGGFRRSAGADATRSPDRQSDPGWTT
jgi:hypothetical protein